MHIKCSDSKATNIEYCKVRTDIRDYFAEYIQTCFSIDKTRHLILIDYSTLRSDPRMCAAVWGAGRKVFKCVDVHCGGEPARVLLSGCPRVEGADMLERRKYFMTELDQVRRVLLTEPRGYPCQNLNIILPPSDSRAEAGYIIAEQNGIYPLFSGHNTICVVTALLETGHVTMTEPISRFKLESPGGLISVEARCEAGRVTEVNMTSLPSFVGRRDVEVEVPSLGKVTVDLVFGGMWFVIVSAEQLGLEIRAEEGGRLARLGEMIKVAAREQSPISHPALQYEGPDILAWTEGSGLTRRNTVVMSNKVLHWDRPDTQAGRSHNYQHQPFLFFPPPSIPALDNLS